jgi:hypothetical protein
MRLICPKDAAFKAAFADKVVRTTDSRNNRIVRYILCKLEYQTSGTAHDFESDAFNIEHVLPQNPGDDWTAFTDKEIPALVHRLGNLALMAKKQNKDLGNASYAKKRSVLQASHFAITKELGDDNSDWNPARIEARQRKLANLATTVWKISQLA